MSSWVGSHGIPCKRVFPYSCQGGTPGLSCAASPLRGRLSTPARPFAEVNYSMRQGHTWVYSAEVPPGPGSLHMLAGLLTYPPFTPWSLCPRQMGGVPQPV